MGRAADMGHERGAFKVKSAKRAALGVRPSQSGGWQTLKSSADWSNRNQACCMISHFVGKAYIIFAQKLGENVLHAARKSQIPQ
jgi:hypothetical protein